MKLILARTIDCSAEGCRVQPLDADEPIDAPLAPRMVESGIRVRPGMIVALDRDTTPPTIRYRFATLPVEALTGDRITLLGREVRFVDVRPAADRATPIRVGDTVTHRFRPGGDEIEIYDTVVDGQPRHPELLEADFPRIEELYQEKIEA